MRPTPRPWIVIALLVALCVTAQPLCAALPRRPESIQSFLQRLPTIKVGKDGVRIRVEGRFERTATVRNGRAIKLLKCDVPFSSNRPLPQLRDTTDVIQVTGQLFRDALGKPFVRVTAVETLPSDLAWVRYVRSQWKMPTAEQLVELGKWARERAAFYEDKALAQVADSLFRDAIELQRSGLEEEDFAGYFALAEQARQYGLPAVLQWELLHEAFAAQAKQLVGQSAEAKVLFDLAEHIAEQLPGASRPVPHEVWQEHRDYWKDPRGTYAAAQPEQRRELHRRLYGEVVLAAIRAAYPKDGRAGLEAARQLQRLLPEAVEEAEALRLAALKYRFEHLDQADREEMLRLAEQYRIRGQPQKAQEVVSRWLQLREKQLRPLGGAGLVRLARDVWETTRDDARTLQLLKEAAPLLKNADPASIEMQDLRQLFGQFGYVQRNGKWFPKDAPVARTPESPRQHALIGPGMSAQEVRRLLGQPSRRTRIVTRKLIVELWEYPTTGLAVRMVREPGQDTPVVAALHPLRGR